MECLIIFVSWFSTQEKKRKKLFILLRLVDDFLLLREIVDDLLSVNPHLSTPESTT